MISLRARRVSRLHIVLAGGTALWITAVVAGSWTLWNHAASPGIAAAPPSRWPAGSRLEKEPGKPMLVMFAHPKCPCTRASIRELERLLVQSGSRCNAAVVFVQPAGTSADWPRTDTWRLASVIPGVQVLLDDAGVEAARFGAKVSGQTLLYDATGDLQFQGGITSARGHEGASAGQAAIVACLHGQPAPACEPTFGCSLLNPTLVNLDR